VVQPEDDVAAKVLELTSGRGADVAIDVSGSPEALQTCIDAAGFGASVIVASWYGTREVRLALGAGFHRKRLRLLSSQVSTLDPAVSGRWDRARRLELATDLLCDLPLERLVTHRFPFRRAAAAYELLDQQPADCLQVVLDHD
jgi:threonine dehydrogenase-like Zn-dependent dehydrogenase